MLGDLVEEALLDRLVVAELVDAAELVWLLEPVVLALVSLLLAADEVPVPVSGKSWLKLVSPLLSSISTAYEPDGRFDGTVHVKEVPVWPAVLSG